VRHGGNQAAHRREPGEVVEDGAPIDELVDAVRQQVRASAFNQVQEGRAGIDLIMRAFFCPISQGIIRQPK
jgi:hypothetical protein